MGVRVAVLAAAVVAAAIAVVVVIGRTLDDGAAPRGDSVAELRAMLHDERQAREALEAKLDRLAGDVAALREDRGGIDEASAAASVGAATGATGDDTEARLADDADPSPGHAWFDERRLAAAGLPERDVADLKRVFDEIELERLYLQNQASRERWPPARLNAEMNALTDRQLQIRTTYGDETYDWFLYATNRPNRVMVEGVLGGSAAEEAGIKPGDLILSYDRERVFRPGRLVQGTLNGSLDDRVDVEIWRQGERIQLTLPRGPLGVRLGRKTAAPDPLVR